MRIAVIGAGISGLGAAHYLERDGHAVTLYEAADYFGGHTHTVDVTLDGVTASVDTGFLVCNDRTYPNLLRLFEELGVELAPSDMSFAVRAEKDDIEWSGTNFLSLFAQPANALKPKFLRFLADIIRFNRIATAMAASNTVPAVSLREFLATQGFSPALFDWYLWPMVGSIWSTPRGDVLDFELPMLLRFCHNHGLLAVTNRPQWMTVRGGAKTYVQQIVSRLKDARIAAPVERIERSAVGVDVFAATGREHFDAVVLACHSDQALRLLSKPTHAEKSALSAIRYQPNHCVLHTDASLMPKRRAAWSAWNYLQVNDTDNARPVALTYWMNQLQPLPFTTPLFETLNPPKAPAQSTVLAEFEYSHPLLNRTAIAAQREIEGIQGQNRTWFAGAWLANGFHEDGLLSALNVVRAISAANVDEVPQNHERLAAE
jgi:predicted NAD/FAD-binding protein